MSELLITLEDVGTDPQSARAGDVIAVQDDNAGWGTWESAHPQWTILCLPLVTVSEASCFATPGRVSDGETAPYRAFGLDLARLPTDRAAITYADLDAARITRDAVADPNVFGANPRVFG